MYTRAASSVLPSIWAPNSWDISPPSHIYNTANAFIWQVQKGSEIVEKLTLAGFKQGQKSAKNLPKICQKKAKNLPKICQKSAKVLKKVKKVNFSRV
jgi:hypothetical protein